MKQKKERRGRKKILTERDSRLLKRKLMNGKKVTLRKLSEKASKETIRRAMKSKGLKYFKKSKKPLITIAAKAKRIKFAKDMLNMDDEDWKKVIFTDETRVNVFGNDYSLGYWSKSKNNKETMKTVKYGGGRGWTNHSIQTNPKIS